MRASLLRVARPVESVENVGRGRAAVKVVAYEGVITWGVEHGWSKPSKAVWATSKTVVSKTLLTRGAYGGRGRGGIKVACGGGQELQCTHLLACYWTLIVR